MYTVSMRSKVLILFILASAGLLFSGYLSAAKLVSETCAFNEPCPYFLGHPACWYGFAMYLIMFIVTGGALVRKMPGKDAAVTDAIVSFAGILFAGGFVIQEIAQSKVTGALGLSTCAYGLIFYIAIFIVSLIPFRKTA